MSLVTWVLAAPLLLSAAAPVPTMQVVSLDGTQWRLAPDSENVGWKQQWWQQPQPEAVPARVPWVIQDAFPGYHGVAWYWRAFVAPANPHPQGRYLLRFGAVNYKADVWLQDRYVGGHENGEMPFLFDVTALIRPFQVNRLAVRVVEPRFDVPVDGMTKSETPYRGSAMFEHGGIEGPVDLLLVPAARLADLYVKPDWRTGGIALEITFINASEQTLSGRLELSVSPANRSERLDSKSLNVHLKPGQSFVTAELQVNNPSLWDLDSPNQYSVTARLATRELPQSEDEVSVRCGFRDFRFENGAFRLNGKRILLRSTPQSNFDPIGFWLPYDLGADPDVFQRRLLYAKQVGFNMVRVHRAAARPNMLELCDRIGLMVYEENFASNNFSDSSFRADRQLGAYREMVLRDRNHPSIVMWGLLNELRAQTANFQEAVRSLPLVRSLDQTRMVMLNSGRFDNLPSIGSLSNPGSFEWQHLLGNESPTWIDSQQFGNIPVRGQPGYFEPYGAVPEIGDIHHYEGVPLNAERMGPYRDMGANTRNPVILTEFGIGSGVDLATLWEFFEKHKATHLESAQYTKRMLDQFMSDWQRWRLQETFKDPKTFFYEGMRRSSGNRLGLLNAVRSNPKIVGFSHVALEDRPMLGQGMVTMYDELKPGIKEAMLDALAPARFCLFVEPVSCYRGQKVRVEAVLANADGLAPGEYPVQLQILDGNSSVVFEKQVVYRVPQATDREPPMAAPLLSQDVVMQGAGERYRFTARFTNGPTIPGGNTSFFVFDPHTMPAVAQGVVLWGADEKLAGWLKENGIRWRPFDPAVSNRRELLLVSEAPPAPGGRSVFEELARRLARGSAAVFLSEKVFQDGSQNTHWLPLPSKGVILRTRNWLSGKDEFVKDHPVFAGLQSDGVMDYAYYRDLLDPNYGIFTRLPAPEAAIAGAIASTSFQTDTGIYHSGLMVAEYKLGAGRFLLNTLLIRDNLGKAPQAERLLRNMLNYMARDIQEPLAGFPNGFEAQLGKLYETHAGQAPAIEIVVPHDSAVVKAPGTISIEVRTSTVDLRVRRVEFFSNGAKIGEDAVQKRSSNYCFIWPNVARGNYELVAKAVAEDGQVSESQRVRVRVEEAAKSR